MCYEDVFGNERREEGAHSQFMLTLVNDSWDGDTKPMSQHLQISQARALETAKPILRAANTGWTAAIDHHGQVSVALRPESVGALVTKVQPRVGTTPYVIFGDSLPMGLVGFGVLIAGLAERRARSDQKQQTETSL
jgi:apolipoprotein N-acyltransferase